MKLSGHQCAGDVRALARHVDVERAVYVTATDLPGYRVYVHACSITLKRSPQLKGGRLGEGELRQVVKVSEVIARDAHHQPDPPQIKGLAYHPVRVEAHV